MNYLKNLCFTLWSLLNLASAAFAAFFCYFVMTLRYDGMHTTSTAQDPMLNLTRETVFRHVALESLQFAVGLLLLAGAFWGLNHFIYFDAKWQRYKKWGFAVSLGCSVLLIAGLVMADVYCLRRYPEI